MHHLVELLTLFFHLFLSRLAIETLAEKLSFLTLEFLNLHLALLFQFFLRLSKFTFFLLCLCPDLLFLRLELCCEVLVIDLELIELVLIGLLVRIIPVVLGFTVDHWVHV